MITSEMMQAIEAKQIQSLAAKGRKWIEAEMNTIKRSKNLGGGRYEDGTRACLIRDLERLRKAWAIAR